MLTDEMGSDRQSAPPADSLRRRSRRVVLCGAGAAGGAGVLAACSRDGSGQTGSTATGEVVQIDFYHRWQAEREPLMIAQVDDFQKLQSRVRINNNLMFPYDYAKLTSMVV